MFHFSLVILKVLWRVWAICRELQNPFRDKKMAYVFYVESYWILLMHDWTREVGIGKWILKWWIIGLDLNRRIGELVVCFLFVYFYYFL